MHQYHLGSNEEEKDGELVASKVFYQTQPRQCGNSIIKDQYEKILNNRSGHDDTTIPKNAAHVDYYSAPYINYEHVGHNRESSPQLIPNLVVQGDGSSFFRFAMDGNKTRLERK